jgi:hypothetical protein
VAAAGISRSASDDSLARGWCRGFPAPGGMRRFALRSGGPFPRRRISANGSHSGDKSFSRGALYTLLRNPIYVGEVGHRGARYPGQHQPIVGRSAWDKTQELLHTQTIRIEGRPSGAMSSPLIGKLFDDHGERLTPTHAVKGQRRYRYYVSRSLMSRTASESCTGSKARLRTEAEAATALQTLVERAELHPDGMRLSLELPIATYSNPQASTATHLSIRHEIPLRVRRRGN